MGLNSPASLKVATILLPVGLAFLMNLLCATLLLEGKNFAACTCRALTIELFLKSHVSLPKWH